MGKDRANVTDSGHAEFEIPLGDFLGSVVAKTLCFHCRGQGAGVQSLVWELRSHVPQGQKKKEIPLGHPSGAFQQTERAEF